MPDVLPINHWISRQPFEPGDIVAFYGSEWRSRVIELVTGGPSHVGIVCEWPLADPSGGYETRNLLIESTTMCQRPCVIAGRRIEGVQAQFPWDRINDYGGQATIYRLADHWQLNDAERDDFSDLAGVWMGRPYDFRGALWSGTRILKFLPRMPYSDLGTLFCSELIAACLQRLGRLCVTNAGFFNPASLLRTLVKSGVYLPGVPL